MKTDIDIKQDVIAELGWEPSVNAARIGVEVQEGIVTLAGHVDSYTEKLHAERAAQRVSGVKGLAVEMLVKLPGMSKRTDSDIVGTVLNVLQWTTSLPANAIEVKSENGLITLSGELEWDYQREAARDAVRYLIGVTGIRDQITIRPKAASSVVKSQIEAALKRRAQSDAERISVEVNSDNVTLSGTVHSWSERELAAGTAWASPGVRKVVDNITIAY